VLYTHTFVVLAKVLDGGADHWRWGGQLQLVERVWPLELDRDEIGVTPRRLAARGAAAATAGLVVAGQLCVASGAATSAASTENCVGHVRSLRVCRSRHRDG
jgi:hypothetical protein